MPSILFKTLEGYYRSLPLFVQKHSENVGYYTKIMVDHIMNGKFSEQYSIHDIPIKENIELLGRYHDIGKTGISNEIWLSTKPLSIEEKKIIKTHTVLGANIICNKLLIKNKKIDEADIRIIILKCCLFHHERWDGNGYPFGLNGKDIPFYSRVIGIADAYDAMISDRPYHAGIQKEAALQVIRKEAGKQFDPFLAEVFCNIFERFSEISRSSS